jgi:two-component system response regulator
MENPQIVDILLIEDNPQDAELTTRALKKRNLANHLVIVEDGAEALDFIFGQESYAQRDTSHSPKVILLDLKCQSKWIGGFTSIKKQSKTNNIPIVVVTLRRRSGYQNCV